MGRARGPGPVVARRMSLRDWSGPAIEVGCLLDFRVISILIEELWRMVDKVHLRVSPRQLVG